MSKYITTVKAAELAEVSTGTIRYWCENLGIGVKVAGRWRVDEEKFNAVLDGELDYAEEEDE